MPVNKPDTLTPALDALAAAGLIPDRVNTNCPALIERYGDCRKISADLMIDDKALGHVPFAPRFIIDCHHRLASMVQGEIVAVDFDGTLARLGDWPDFGALNIALIDALRKAQARGVVIVLVTCREKGEHYNLMYEDELPEALPDTVYEWWYELSSVVSGVRMGPKIVK